jgi:hypothetical protein
MKALLQDMAAHVERIREISPFNAWNVAYRSYLSLFNERDHYPAYLMGRVCTLSNASAVSLNLRSLLLSRAQTHHAS